MKSFIFILLACVQFNVFAEEISKVFGEGVFDTSWGNTIEEVKETFPKGTIKKYSEITQLSVKDGRSVFGLARDKKSQIIFSFDSEERLIAVGVYFDGDDFTSLMLKLNTLFGEGTKLDTGVLAIQWPKDNEVVLTLSMIPSSFSTETIFTIAYYGLNKPNKSKKQLGF